MQSQYLFRSERLGFRNWLPSDLDKMAAINADAEVMRFFPSTQSREQTEEFIQRMQRQFSEVGFCYFAVDDLDAQDSNDAFIGFIGLSKQMYEAPFTPCIDIGWRLRRDKWGQGLASEGAKTCLNYAFDILKIEKIYAVAPVINIPSERVMQKIGMSKVGTFLHPALASGSELHECLIYEITPKIPTQY